MNKSEAQKKAIDEIYNKKGDFKEKKEGKTHKKSDGYKCPKCGAKF